MANLSTTQGVSHSPFLSLLPCPLGSTKKTEPKKYCLSEDISVRREDGGCLSLPYSGGAILTQSFEAREQATMFFGGERRHENIAFTFRSRVLTANAERTGPQMQSDLVTRSISSISLPPSPHSFVAFQCVCGGGKRKGEREEGRRSVVEEVVVV